MGVEVLEPKLSFSLLLLRPRSLVEFTTEAITLGAEEFVLLQLLLLLFVILFGLLELFICCSEELDIKGLGVDAPEFERDLLVPFTILPVPSRARDEVEESADCRTVLTDKSNGDSRLTPTIFDEPVEF
jgi:hypothetical protein